MCYTLHQSRCVVFFGAQKIYNSCPTVGLMFGFRWIEYWIILSQCYGVNISYFDSEKVIYLCRWKTYTHIFIVIQILRTCQKHFNWLSLFRTQLLLSRLRRFYKHSLRSLHPNSNTSIPICGKLGSQKRAWSFKKVQRHFYSNSRSHLVYLTGLKEFTTLGLLWCVTQYKSAFLTSIFT